MNFQRFYVLEIGLSEKLFFYYFHDKKETLGDRE
jgi:hypothetical protein